MSLPRTFVGFSSADIRSYWLMCAWKEHEHIDFNFTDCQLTTEINSENEIYIKSKCRARINMAGTYVLLIGRDTRSKHKYVRWEAEVALEKECRIIGVNLDGSRQLNEELCPPIIRDVGAVFVPFSARILAHALRTWDGQPRGWWYYQPHVYRALGYLA